MQFGAKLVQLQKWFIQGNSRRFQRVDIHVQCYITPKDPIDQREVFALGINYFTEQTHNQIQSIKEELRQLLKKLPGEHQKIDQMFWVILQQSELFADAIKQVSAGKSPQMSSLSWQHLLDHRHGFRELQTIEHSSPKTYQYLKAAEKKFTTFLNFFIQCLQQSNQKHFSAIHPLPEANFEIDQLVKSFRQPKFSHLPLAQLLLKLCEIMGLIINVFSDFYNDLYLHNYPKLWPSVPANISIGGIALTTSKHYEKFMRVKVRLYFAATRRTLEFDGVVVNTKEEAKGEWVAINFELPDGSMQDELQQMIYQYEIHETFGLKLPY